MNLLQAAFVELDPDEAYYWVYSLQLDLGYFDHPPMIALMIRLGRALLSGELGVRLPGVLLMNGALWLLYDLAGRPRLQDGLLTFLLILLGMPMLEVYGFIATPDSPLLFFTTLYLWWFRKFLQKQDVRNTLILGAIMALLLYSKYHGVLVILLILIPHWRLLRAPAIYLAGIWGALLFLPHLWWQYAHDFPSFRYHLQGRDDPYEFKHTTNYLLNQFLIFSPFFFPLILRALARIPFRQGLERSFPWLVYGFWGFFLYTTLKGHVEPQWTAVLSLVFVLILFRQSRTSARIDRWTRLAGGATFAFLLLARILLVLELPWLKTDFHERAWIGELQDEAAGKPVLFQNSYRDPSKYAFYSGDTAYTFTTVYYRKNQYDLWDWEKNLQGREVLLVTGKDDVHPGSYLFSMTGKERRLTVVDQFQTAKNLTCTPVDPGPLVWKAGQTVSLSLDVQNPYSYAVRPKVGSLPLLPVLVLFRDGIYLGEVQPDRPELPDRWPPGRTRLDDLEFRLPADLAGAYQLGFTRKTGALPALKPWTFYPLQVTP